MKKKILRKVLQESWKVISSVVIANLMGRAFSSGAMDHLRSLARAAKREKNAARAEAAAGISLSDLLSDASVRASTHQRNADVSETTTPSGN